MRYLFTLKTGYLDQNSLNNLEEIAYKSMQQKSNLTFWYSHYPTSTITCQDSGRLRTMLSHYGSIYMCGHLHDLAGLANEMYAIHPHGEYYFLCFFLYFRFNIKEKF